MKNLILILFASLFLLSSCDKVMENKSNDTTSDFSPKKITVTYPSIKKVEIVDNYHGKAISDPYRWLEDDRSNETSEWVKAQNAVTFDYLEQIPYREAIQERLKEVWNYEKFSTPIKKGGKYYFFKNDGLQNQGILYAQKTLDDPAEKILDINQFSKDGTTSIGEFSFNKAGNLFAFQLSAGGSDWRVIRILNLENNKLLTDSVSWVKFSNISWFHDGFFYSRYPESTSGSKLSDKNTFHQIYYHKLGTPQSEDVLTYIDRSNPQRTSMAKTTSDERFLTLSIGESTSGNALYFKDLSKNEVEFSPVMETFDADFQVIDNDGNKLIVLTNHKAPNNRLIAIDTENPEEENWIELIPESKKDPLREVTLVNEKIIGTFIHQASSLVRIYDMTGKSESDLKLPAVGTVSDFTGSKTDSEAFFAFENFLMAPRIYSLDLGSKKISLFKKPEVNFPMKEYETKQVWYKSYDGTKIPMFITHKKGLKMDGKRPTLLYGYGGFDIPILPSFKIENTVLLENDGIFAVANIRGGGEFGKDWHKEGTLENKQNVFNDFISAAEYLISNEYTNSDKLAIQGRSNGGLLVGACMTQRPDLFKVALPAVGVMDMLRYHNFTIGWAWAGDYGRSDDPEAFKYLIKYSPLHNIKEKAYPATLVTTADHDDRVVPAHSFKFISELQDKHNGENPVLIRIDTNAGHGAGKSTSQKIMEFGDMAAFMLFNMGEDVIYEYKVEQ